MADANTELQLMATLLTKANEEILNLGKVSEATQEAITDAQMKAKYGIENFTKGTKTAGDALGALAGAGIASTKAMYEGKKGAAAFNSSLDELSKAATLAGTALTLLLPGGIIMKAVIGGLTMAATAAIAYTKAANDMADKLYQGYSKLQESGAAASDGMTGVYQDAKKLGLSMNQLDSMVGLVAANSQELALMSGSVAEGRKRFASMGEALESSRAGFFKMGISQEAQNEALMRYTKNQTLSGRAQNMSNKEMADGARAYIYEQDKLTKLTGMSAQKQQATLDKAREHEQFNSKLRSLEIKGDAESLAAAERLKKGLQFAASAGIEEAFMATVNGNLRSVEAQKGNISTFGELARYTQGLTDGTVDAAAGFKKVAGAGADYEKTIGIQRSMLDAGTDSQFKTGQMQKLALYNQMDVAEMEKKIAADQLKQQQGAGDAITNQMGNMIKKQQGINKKLEDDVFKGIPNALANMDRLTDVTDKLADAFGFLTTGINKLLNLLGLGVKEPDKPKEKTAAEAAAAKATDAKRDAAKPLQDRVDALAKTLDADEKALKDLKRAGKYGAELKPLEDKILKNKEEYEKTTKELTDVEKTVREAAMEEKKIRMKQVQDQKKLSNLERENLNDAEKIKDLNEEKANRYKQTAEIEKQITALTAEKTELAKQGKSTAMVDRRLSNLNLSKQQDSQKSGEIDKQIDARKASIEGRSGEVSQLQAQLKTTPVAAKSAGGGGSNPTKTDTLKEAGIKMKKGDVQKEGADLSPKIIEMAKSIQDNVEGFAYFSGFNDNFHNENASSSKHTKGLAADFALEKKPNPKQGAEVVSWLKDQGASLAIDEYNNPSAKATAGHIHVEIPTFAEGGELAAGKLGIAGEAGPEFVQGPASITPMGDITGVFNNMAMMIGQQTGAIEELIRIAKNGNDIQTKLLRVQQ